MNGLRLSSPAWKVYRTLRDHGANPAPFRALGFTDATVVALLAEIRAADLARLAEPAVPLFDVGGLATLDL